MKDHERKDRAGTGREDAPRTAREQDSPQPERPARPAEEAGVAPHQLDEPPQAEGDREEDDDG